MLVLALQLGCMLLVGAVVNALTQPFMPLYWGATVLVAALIGAGFFFWRGAGNLQGHARSGAEIIAETLSKEAPDAQKDELALARAALDGLGTPTPLPIRAGSPAIGRSLRQLNLRGVTGATVLAIRRRQGDLVLPGPDDVLGEGDVLALSGSLDALAAAGELLAPRA